MLSEMPIQEEKKFEINSPTTSYAIWSLEIHADISHSGKGHYSDRLPEI